MTSSDCFHEFFDHSELVTQKWADPFSEQPYFQFFCDHQSKSLHKSSQRIMGKNVQKYTDKNVIIMQQFIEFYRA